VAVSRVDVGTHTGQRAYDTVVATLRSLVKHGSVPGHARVDVDACEQNTTSSF
jgi:hypothetical protein